jgi:hypothetical protein
MFRLLLYSHLQAEPQTVLYTINNALYSTRSRLHIINIYCELEIVNVISNVKYVIKLKIISNKILNVGRIIVLIVITQ